MEREPPVLLAARAVLRGRHLAPGARRRRGHAGRHRDRPRPGPNDRAAGGGARRGREPARAGSAEGLGRATTWTLLDSGRDIVVRARSRERLAVVGEPSGPGSLARGVLARITCEGAC